MTTTVYELAKPRRPRRHRRLRLRHVVAAGLVVTAGAVTLDALTPAAAVAHHQLVLRYNPDGVQMLCSNAQRGQVATVVGDGRPFTAKCEQDGPVISTWNAQPRPAAASGTKSSHHILSKLLMVHRLVRVHRVFRIHRPFWRLRRWFR